MAVLVHRGVTRTLVSMAAPMLAGTFAMNTYSLTDTWFISQLGTLPLAAMGFVFPVVMLLTCVARGIGSGVTTLVAHAFGRHDDGDARELVGVGMIVILAVTAIMSVGGYMLIGPVFGMLGADAQTMPLVGRYMRMWYVGAVFMTLPMLGNGILISAGDSKAASGMMILGTLLNLVLDPIMIFGLLGCPAMGIRGAALATVLAQAVTTVWLLWLLGRKHGLIRLRTIDWSRCSVTLRRIAGFAVPSILSMILMPVSAAVITRLLSGFGYQTVAAVGAAGRIEMFAFMVPMALGISLTPFISQNFGAQRMDRVREARRVSTVFAIGYGFLTAVVFWLAAGVMAAAFTDDPKVAATLVSYIRIVSFGYGMMEVHRYCTFFLTGMHKPVAATVLNTVRVLVLLLPLSYAGSLLGVNGVFGGRLLTDVLGGCIGIIWVGRILSRCDAADCPSVE